MLVLRDGPCKGVLGGLLHGCAANTYLDLVAR
jgi:hypothetical protein